MNRIIFSYFAFLIVFVAFSYLFVDANFLYFRNLYTGFVTSQRFLTTLAYSFSILIFFIFYTIFLKRNINLKILIGITCIVLFFSNTHMLSQDIFNYLTTAKVLFMYHENPYIIMPVEFIGDLNLLFTHAANKIALYGPIWILLSGIPYLFGFGNFILTLFNFKLMMTLFYIGTILLVKKLSGYDFSLVLFALNPLVIVETLVGNHNDIVMMFFALLSYYLLKRKKILLAILSLLVSILIKYATVFLIPIFILVVFKILRNKKIDWNDVYYKSTISMLLIFLLSALRVEIYPWYAIWFLTFASLIPQKKILLYISFAFSFGLLFRYVPFMLLGTHFGIAPTVKTFVTFVPVILVLIYGRIKKIYR